jgi:hypothetical protein
MPPKKEKKPRKKVMKQKQSQKQSVVVNITAPVAPKRKRTRKVKAPEPRTGGVSTSHHTFFTAPQMPPPTITQNPIPLSFYDTNRPMNMGFSFNTPVRDTRIQEVDTPIIEPAIYGVEDNSEVVNNPDENEITSIAEPIPAYAEQETTPREKIRNPLTGSLIVLGGGTHQKLIKKRVLDEMGNLIRNPEKIY